MSSIAFHSTILVNHVHLNSPLPKSCTLKGKCIHRPVTKITFSCLCIANSSLWHKAGFFCLFFLPQMRVSVLSPKSYYGDFFLVFLCITVHYSITVLSHILVFKVFCCKSGLQPCCTELTKSCDLSAGSGRVST